MSASRWRTLGQGGAGKSSFALHLSQVTGWPVISVAGQDAHERCIIDAEVIPDIDQFLV